MKTIPAGEFKAHCLSLLKELSQKHEPIVVTKYGKPIARVEPIKKTTQKEQNPLKDSILFEKNIIDPIDAGWEAAQ